MVVTPHPGSPSQSSRYEPSDMLGSRCDAVPGHCCVHAGYGVRDRNFDLQRGEFCAAFHANYDIVLIDGDVLAQRSKDLFAQNADQVGMLVRRALMRQQDLQPLACERSRAPAAERIEQIHAALPNSLPMKRLRSPWMLMASSSPFRRRAASTHARAG